MKIRLSFLILTYFFILNYSYSDEKFELGKDKTINSVSEAYYINNTSEYALISDTDNHIIRKLIIDNFNVH